MRFLAVFLLLLAWPLPGAERGALQVEALAPPAPAAALGTAVTAGPDGAAWLTWLERAGEDTALRLAVFDAASGKWSEPRTIARGANWVVSSADFPALAVGADGHATAAWLVRADAPAAKAAGPSHAHADAGSRAFFSRTADGGRTWSAPALLTRESDSVEFVSLATLADGRVLAAWLDGRAKTAGGAAQQLFSRIVGDTRPDTRVDASVCDCCQTTLTAFPDGTALLAYRGRDAGEVRDIRVTRFRGERWDEPAPLNDDGWRIVGCPVNGPQLASDGGRVAAAWFTAADNDPRVLATLSPDAGRRFLTPLRLSETPPAGRVATQLLHDGAILVTWVDVDGSLWLRRVTPDFTPAPPLRLSPASAGRIKGFPRLALLRDYAGGTTAAQFLVAFTHEPDSAVRTLLVTVPEGELLESEKNCDCAPSADQLQGFPIRGRIGAATPGAGVLRVEHFEVPGIFAEGEHDFRVAPETIAAAGSAGGQFLGRIERRDGAWWLFALRRIASPPP